MQNKTLSNFAKLKVTPYESNMGEKGLSLIVPFLLNNSSRETTERARTDLKIKY